MSETQINKSVKLELVSNQRRDPKRLQKAYDMARETYPWLPHGILTDMAKKNYDTTK